MHCFSGFTPGVLWGPSGLLGIKPRLTISLAVSFLQPVTSYCYYLVCLEAILRDYKMFRDYSWLFA